MTTIGSVEDYASLRKLTPGEYDFVLVRRGFSNDPDPQLPILTPPDGGVFVWDEAGYENDNGGTIIVPNEPNQKINGVWKRLYTGRINVKWFNAKGDGSTDDLEALKAAAKAADILNADIEFPTGTYFVSDTWELSARRCNLVGIGDATIISLNPQELATLTKTITTTMKIGRKETKYFPKTITVSSTEKFTVGQKILIVGIDASNHVIGTSKEYTIKAINESKRTLTLTEGVVSDYEPFNPTTKKGTLILSSSISSIIQFNKDVEDASIENIHVEGLGPLVFGVQHSGISFMGKGSLRCLNVESCNNPHNGIFIYDFTYNLTINKNENILGERHFYFSNCNMHDNGYAGINIHPFVTIKRNNPPPEILTGSVQVIGGIYSNNGPEWSGSSAYGMTLNGSKTVVAGQMRK